jgi:hypothetical protein
MDLPLCACLSQVEAFGTASFSDGCVATIFVDRLQQAADFTTGMLCLTPIAHCRADVAACHKKRLEAYVAVPSVIEPLHGRLPTRTPLTFNGRPAEMVVLTRQFDGRGIVERWLDGPFRSELTRVESEMEVVALVNLDEGNGAVVTLCAAAIAKLRDLPHQ